MTIDQILNPSRRPTPAQITSAFATTLAVSETIRELRQIPSGELYATLCGRLSLADYNAAIAMLQRAGLVTEHAHMLTWAGPEFPAAGGAREFPRNVRSAERRALRRAERSGTAELFSDLLA